MSELVWWCYGCRESRLGMAHCADPLRCGGMKQIAMSDLAAQGIETAKPPRREAGLAREGESPVAAGDAPKGGSND